MLGDREEVGALPFAPLIPRLEHDEANTGIGSAKLSSAERPEIAMTFSTPGVASAMFVAFSSAAVVRPSEAASGSCAAIIR